MPADATVTLFVAPPLIVFVFQRASGESCVDVCPIESVLFQANVVPSGLEITKGLNPCVLEMIEIVVVAACAGSAIPSASVTAVTGVPQRAIFMGALLSRVSGRRRRRPTEYGRKLGPDCAEAHLRERRSDLGILTRRGLSRDAHPWGRHR